MLSVVIDLVGRRYTATAFNGWAAAPLTRSSHHARHTASAAGDAAVPVALGRRSS